MSNTQPYATHARAMTLIPREGADYPGEPAIWQAYHAGDDFVCFDGQKRGGVINRSDIVRYTPVQTVTVLYDRQTKAYTFDARSPAH